MSESKFGGPPRNGKQVKLTFGHPDPTPYHVEVWNDGQLVKAQIFTHLQDAERCQREELLT